MQILVVINNQDPQPQQRRTRLHRPPPSRNMRSTGGAGTSAVTTHATRPSIRAQDPRRQRCKQIADGTIAALQNGFYDEPIAHSNRIYRHDISGDIRNTERHTVFFPDDSIELLRWQTTPSLQRPPSRQTKLSCLPLSTIEGVRYMDNLASVSPQRPLTGVLNFASATRPGGGFLTGAVAQEESIARSSSLYSSLSTPIANNFYASNTLDEKGGFYSHAMIYSPNVLLFRDDDGTWIKPTKMEVITSPAVNAKAVRENHRTRNQGDGGSNYLEARIRDVMRERMARVLALFELRGVRNIVLGSFGTGVFQNDVRMVAGIWRELLYGRQARFATSFDNVLFAIPDKKTLDKFKDGFGPVRNPL